MNNPLLSIYERAGKMLAQNQEWSRGNKSVLDLITAPIEKVNAFALNPSGNGSTVVLTFPPGTYTAAVWSADGSRRTALVAVYQVPE